MTLKMKWMGLVAAALITLAGCGGGGSVTIADDGSTEVAFELVVQGQTGLDKPQTFVIQDLGGWQTFWGAHTRFLDPPPDLPFIDFRSEMVIGVYLGKRGDQCSRLEINNVLEKSNRLVVGYQEVLPQAGQVCAQVVTDLLKVIVLPKSNLPVEFVAL